MRGSLLWVALGILGALGKGGHTNQNPHQSFQITWTLWNGLTREANFAASLRAESMLKMERMRDGPPTPIPHITSPNGRGVELCTLNFGTGRKNGKSRMKNAFRFR
ncbi:hypothetical protein JEQ12_009778 [Ovis aries]|uniref:Uncharacterized protein n=1 Tax=Ovis aries TaxID=9940 RepID=A0A836ADV6_SHEEP|nr:hypothetical protein JEQ12_009778 [Ovis aries]